MTLVEFLRTTRRIVLVMSRPKREEMLLTLRVSLLGVAVIGAIGFMVRVVFWFVHLAP